MFGHEDALRRLDETWRSAIERGDLAYLRRRAYAAIVFALCSVHTPVEQGEWEFEQVMSTGEFPVDGGRLQDQKASGLMALDAWIETTTLDTFAVDGWTLADTILRSIYGLGTAKAAFASALCGNPEPYCIDTHGAQLIADRTGDRPSHILGSIKADKAAGSKAIAAAWRRYRRWGDTTFGARNHQWEFFAIKVPEFRDGGHAVYFAEPFVGLVA